jgi:hypothetical protein
MVRPARRAVVLRLVVSASMVLGATATARAQVPPPQPAAAGEPAGPPPKGFILGQVVDAASGRPVSGAVVSLQGSTQDPAIAGPIALDEATFVAGLNAPGPGQVITDSEGRFLFRSLGKGSYGLSVRAGGYGPGSYGQRRPGGPSRRVALEEDQRLSDVTVRLWKYASISGRLVDEAGEPAIGASVTLSRLMFYGGRRRYTSAGSVSTDDRGQYRLGTLVPGTYIVQVRSTITTVPASIADLYQQAISSPGGMNALPMDLMMMGSPTMGIRVGDYSLQYSGLSGRSALPPPPAPDGRLSVYPTLFYPSATLVSQATPITVASGEDRTGIDMTLRLVRATTVSGVVNGPEGPAGMVSLRLQPGGVDKFTSDMGFETATSITAADGTFRFLGVPSGSYTLIAQRVPRNVSTSMNSMTTVVQTGGGGMMMTSSGSPLGPAAPLPTAPTLAARLPLTVGDADVKDLSVTVNNGARISGRVEFTGGATPPTAERLSQLSVNLSPNDGGFTMGFTSARLTADGTFQTMSYPPGLYNLMVTSPGAPWAIRAISVKGKDAFGSPLDLGAEDLTGVVVTFGDTPTELSGTVRGTSAVTNVDAVVVIFPANVRSWIESGMSARRARTIGTTTTGEYRVPGLPSGEYLVAALDPNTVVDLQDPQFVNTVTRVATRVTLADGDKKTLPLTISQIR